MPPRGRPPATRNVHSFQNRTQPIPGELLLDTSFVVEALITTQPLHTPAVEFLVEIAEAGVQVRYSALLELELAEASFQLALKERHKRDWKRFRYDGRARPRGARLMEGTAVAWAEVFVEVGTLPRAASPSRLTGTIPPMPRVRRPRRQTPALELLEATLPELRRGLTQSAARTVAYELFEKLGYGAVAVTDTHEVLAFVGAGADHHGAGDTPMRPVYEAITRGGPLLAPLGIRTECKHPACPLGAAAVVPLQLTDGPTGAIVAYATAGSPLDETAVETLNALGTQLSAQLQLSELHSATTTALQAQMEPHFVFNALNTIASFIRTEPERARKLVLAFADHLRSRLARPGEFITLEEELRHVRSYLELEQARFGAQLEVTIDADHDALDVRLPPLLVQPIVENAIKHGKTDRPLHLLVRARVRRGRLRVTVRDDGRGIARDAIDRVLEPGVGEGTGIGLANVNLRLTAHYGEGVKLRSFPFGTVVRLEVPLG
jgi:LytS/YehU family sensor histidine kinase